MNHPTATALYTAARAWNQLHWPGDLPRVKALGPDTLARMSSSEFLSSYCWVVYAAGFDGFKARLLEQKMDALQELPGIGGITKKHLARNIGLVDVAKDDVWLVRVATLFGASCVDSLVAHLAKGSGDGPGAVDLGLWRFSTEAGWKDLGYTSLDEMVCGLCSRLAGREIAGIRWYPR